MTAPHDDCAALRLKCAALEAAIVRACANAPDDEPERVDTDNHGDTFDSGYAFGVWAVANGLRPSLSGEPTALREMLVEAGLRSILSLPGYDADHDTAPMATEAMLRPRVEAAIERILRGGGK